MSEYEDYEDNLQQSHEEEDSELDEEEEAEYSARTATEAGVSRLIGRTWFDEYFALNHKSTKTSANVFSHLLTPLTAPEYHTAIASSAALNSSSLQVPWLQHAQSSLFPKFLSQLESGFNLLAYGAGSKRELLNAFALYTNSRGRHVFVANAFSSAFTLKDLLTSIENIPALLTYPSSSNTGIEAQARRIHHFFSMEETNENVAMRDHIYVVIHGIDALALRAPRAQACLALLAAAPRIHILASADNIVFPALWSLSESFTRASRHAFTPIVDTLAHGGFAWLFHDLTTLAPYDFELTHADRSSIRGASTRARKDAVLGTGAAAGDVPIMTENAARHVLASVTKKAKRLFVMLGSKQLELMASITSSDGEGPGNVVKDPTQVALGYAALFNMARDDFIATNDTALRALMGEFKDHGLMASANVSGLADAVWIPLRRDALVKLVAELKQEG